MGSKITRTSAKQMPTWFSAREKELNRLEEEDMSVETRHLLDEMEAILSETLEESSRRPIIES